jgi:hypothetical protein
MGAPKPENTGDMAEFERFLDLFGTGPVSVAV